MTPEQTKLRQTFTDLVLARRAIDSPERLTESERARIVEIRRDGHPSDVVRNAISRASWCLACQFDGIDPQSSFVCFSPENPYQS